MENKKQKEFYVMVKGQKVIVSEEVYRAFVRPVRTALKREEREKRCVIESVVNGKVRLIRCEGNCSLCDKNKRDNSSFVLSFDLMLDDGLDVADNSINIEEDFIKKENYEELRNAISQLNERQQKIIKLVYFEGISQVEVAKRYGITKCAVAWIIKDIMVRLRKILEK